MKVEAWLVLKAKRNQYRNYPSSSPYAGQPQVDGAKVVKVTANKPALDDDSIAFKIELDIDHTWFLDASATIQATVPAQPQQQATIQAQVDMPIKGRGKSAAASVVKP